MSLHALFQWFVYQQDYLWFLSAFGWAMVLLAWRRLGRANPDLRWLVWAGFTALLTAGVQISQLITPVEQKPFVAPWLAWDLALGAVQAALAGGLWWVLAGAKRWSRWRILPALVLVAVAAAGRYPWPAAGSLGLAVLVLVPAWGLIRQPGFTGTARFALLAVTAAGLLGTNGPLAESLGSPHRYTDMSAYGLSSAGSLLAAAIAAGFVLYRQADNATASTVTQTDLKLLVRVQVLWLLLGLVLAVVMSTWARASFEGNLLARVRMAAELIDKTSLQTFLGPRFRVNQVGVNRFQGRNLPYYRSEFLAENPRPVLAQALTAIEHANPDVDWAMITTLRDGHLLFFAESTQQPASIRPGEYGTYGPPDAATWQSWCARRAEIVGPVAFYYGPVVQARAPLLAPAGQMLGWLIFDVQIAHWLAAQLQARLLAFAVIALGSALLVVNWQQRIRERMRAAAQREADAALAANQVKAAFLAKVSHELRTPIQSLLGYSELLRQRVAEDPKAAGWLAALHQHGELMTRLINDLIDLGAVETGAFKLAARTIEPGSLVSQAVESFRPRAEKKQLSLACFIDPGLPEWVTLDGERFRQVLANLLGNAIKFTDRGGVTVALRKEEADALVLTVRDTGPGIPPQEQGRLFAAFSRLELTADKEGSGLGLALSAALCRAMGGELGVASDGLAGSCFTAVVRAPAAQPLLAAKPVDLLSALRGRRVLVVDDNPLVRELFIAFLTEHGAMCAAAANGREALAQATTSEFNAIILDLALPDGDGTEFVQPLRERSDGARIIGVSAHAGSADRERAMAAGMDDFLTKPVPLGTLAATVADERARPRESVPAFRTADALRERLARQFARELPAQRSELAAALAAREWSRVRALAHYLKNSAVVVRDDALFDVCTGLEQAAAAADETAARHWWTRCSPPLDRWAGQPPASAFVSP